MDLDTISGKTPLIFKEIWLFPNLAGNCPFIFDKELEPTAKLIRAFYKSGDKCKDSC